MFLRPLISGALIIMFGSLSACKTADVSVPTPNLPQSQGSAQSNEPTVFESPNVVVDNNIAQSTRPTTPPRSQTESQNIQIAPPQTSTGLSVYSPAFSDYLEDWETTDLTPALTAFAGNCSVWKNRDGDAALMTSKPDFGQYKDWQSLCSSLPPAPFDDFWARWFFETYFLPANLLSNEPLEGLLTGYYEPEIEVRSRPSGEFIEPILALPNNDAIKNKTRADIYKGQTNYSAHAYGRPIDVFFMQVQGSGRIKFSDGTVKRAAYGGNNGRKYKSIGGVLISRGEMTRDEASKQSIETWMERAGATKARALMNENPRYIYFDLQNINPAEGPKGSMRVPLTAMGSMAIDPKSRPYGVPVWLETTLPQFGGDYKGVPQSLLVIAQDSGSAIKGEGRGDLFFGSGDLAGELAGVMKHDVTMTHLLPRRLVLEKLGIRE